MTTKTETPRIPAIAATIEGLSITFRAAHGDEFTLGAMTLTEEIRTAAMMHGLKQKIGDAAAISRNPDTGRSATTEDKMAAMREVLERLQAGHWNKPREAGAGGGDGGLLFKALCRIKADKTPADIRYWLDGLDKSQQAALRKVPAIANAIEAIRAESAKDTGIDGEALLAGF